MTRNKKIAGACLAGLLFLFPKTGQAQDDLLKMLEEEQEPETEYAFATFKGTRVINLQSPELPGKGVFQYMFLHRFGAFNNDYFYNFLGLNTAEVRLQWDYSFLDWLNVGLGYGSANPRTYDGFVKLRLLRQSTGKRNFPFSVSSYSALYVNGERFEDGLPHYFTDRLSFVEQLIIARKFSPNFSLEIVPTLTHFNLVNRMDDDNDIYALGVGARYKLTAQHALSVEYIYQLNPLNSDLGDVFPDFPLQTNTNSLSLGFDIETGGHVFQLFLTNSRGVSDPYVIAQTTGDWLKGDIHFGFNISRVFTIVRPKEFDEAE